MASGSGSATATTETSEPLLSLFGIVLPIVETDEPLLDLATLHADDYPMNGSCYSGEHYDDGRHRSRSRSRRRRRSRNCHDIYEGPLFTLQQAMGDASSVGEMCRTALSRGSRAAFAPALSMLDGTVSFEKALTETRSRVRRLIRDGSAFYLGISECPQRRYNQHCETGSQWERMVVLVEARSSRDTAVLERQLLEEFHECLGCTNRSLGGECASSGMPHYLYILLNPLMRRHVPTRRAT